MIPMMTRVCWRLEDLWGVTFGLWVWVFGCQATQQRSQYVAGARRCPARGPATQGEAKSGGKRDMFHVYGMERRSLSGSFFLRSGMESVI